MNERSSFLAFGVVDVNLSDWTTLIPFVLHFSSSPYMFHNISNFNAIINMDYIVIYYQEKWMWKCIHFGSGTVDVGHKTGPCKFKCFLSSLYLLTLSQISTWCQSGLIWFSSYRWNHLTNHLLLSTSFLFFLFLVGNITASSCKLGNSHSSFLHSKGFHHI